MEILCLRLGVLDRLFECIDDRRLDMIFVDFNI